MREETSREETDLTRHIYRSSGSGRLSEPPTEHRGCRQFISARMPPARERERISARVESLTSVISNFGLGPFDAKRIKKVTKESFVREKSDDDYLNWAIDVLTADEDLQWEKSAAVAKEVAKGPKKGLRGGEKRTHVNSNNVALDPPSSFGQEASTELLSLQGNAGMGPASSHPRGSQRLAQELPGAVEESQRGGLLPVDSQALIATPWRQQGTSQAQFQ